MTFGQMCCCQFPQCIRHALLKVYFFTSKRRRKRVRERSSVNLLNRFVAPTKKRWKLTVSTIYIYISREIYPKRISEKNIANCFMSFPNLPTAICLYSCFKSSKYIAIVKWQIVLQKNGDDKHILWLVWSVQLKLDRVHQSLAPKMSLVVMMDYDHSPE